MKKRRFWAAITVMILAIVTVCSFVACNEKDDPSKMKGEEVTAEQWVKAFDFSDVTKIATTMVTSAQYDGIVYKSTRLVEYDGNKMHYKTTSEYTDENGKAQKGVKEYYRAKENDKIYEYEYDEEDNEWYRYEAYYGNDDWSIGDFGSFANDFDKFTYDTNKKGYVATYDIDGEDIAVLIKIKNGKFAYTEQSGKKLGMPTTVTIAISGINSTSITLPAIA